MSQFTKHLERWGNCEQCELHKVRTKVVLWRGSKIPCDVLFTGEAPGLTEDIEGLPFTGPAGRLLDQIVERSIPNTLSVGFTNLIACIPRAVPGGSKVGEPPPWAIKACADRLREIIKIANPARIVTVGTLAKKYLPSRNLELPAMVSIVHPAAILRSNPVQKEAAIRQCIITLTEMSEDL